MAESLILPVPELMSAVYLVPLALSAQAARDRATVGLSALMASPVGIAARMMLDAGAVTVHAMSSSSLPPVPARCRRAAAPVRAGRVRLAGLFVPGEAELAQVRDTFACVTGQRGGQNSTYGRRSWHDQDAASSCGRCPGPTTPGGRRLDRCVPRAGLRITVRQGVGARARGASSGWSSGRSCWPRALIRTVGTWITCWTGTRPLPPRSSATSPRRGPRILRSVAPPERLYSLRREATDSYRAVQPLLAGVSAGERATEAARAAAVPGAVG